MPSRLSVPLTWRLARCALVAAVLVIAGAVAAPAQTPPAPRAPPAPEQPHEARPDCSTKGVKAMEDQIALLEGLEKTAPETIALVCRGVDLVTGFMALPEDEPVTGALGDIARQLLGRSLTPRMVKAMCRQAEGETARNLRTEIGQLKDRVVACRGV